MPTIAHHSIAPLFIINTIMAKLTLESLPTAFSELMEKVDKIEGLFSEWITPQPVSPERWFDLNEICEYLPDKPAKATVYSWVSKRYIPFHKGGKKLRFLKSDIDSWLNTGRRKTISEAENEANTYIIKKGSRES